MITLSLAQILTITNGQMTSPLMTEQSLTLDSTFEHISTDTRTLKTGDVFVALVGERFDAHDFIEKATQASLLIVSRPVNSNVPQVIVKDTLFALGALGQAVKRLANVKTIAITGSCGKTTVKELLASICRCAGETHATAGNFNNEIGVPLTLLGLEQRHQYAVIELGANHIGEIAYTVGLTEPDAALVNNVSGAHLEGFGSLQGVAQAKGEIYGGLSSYGTAIVNLDCDYIQQWRSRLDSLPMIAFGFDCELADITATNIQLNQSNSQFDLLYQNKTYPVELHLVGLHNISNALAAAACALAVDIPIEKVLAGLSNTDSVAGRLQLITVNPHLKIIDDSYNANEASMKAALDVLANQSGQKIFVMGDMAELGEHARSAHQAVGNYARAAGIKDIYTLGALSLHAQLGHEHDLHFSHLNDLMQRLNQQLTNAPVCVLVKGSRSAKMEKVVQALQAQQGLSSC